MDKTSFTRKKNQYQSCIRVPLVTYGPMAPAVIRGFLGTWSPWGPWSPRGPDRMANPLLLVNWRKPLGQVHCD